MAPILAILILLLPATTAAAPASSEIQADTFNSSVRCGQCHEEIYKMWRKSLHSAAYSDPVFEASYVRAYRDSGGKAASLCLSCHAPVATHTNDLDLKNPVSTEGITCDYCHSVVAVDMKDPQHPLKVKLDGIKRGPLGDADSPAHGVEHSSLHQDSAFCGGCHEYENDLGLAVMTTYSEWLRSPQAAEGKTCQSCHMPLGPGDTVIPSLQTKKRQINLHNISGGHSREQVRKAATVRIIRIERREEHAVRTEVEVANVGSGHSIPTGMPTRKLTLELVLYVNGREVRRFQREYQKQIADERGRLIVEDHRTMLYGKSVILDNRLKPGERRLERFDTVVRPKGVLSAEAKLYYTYEPRVLVPQKMSIEMATDKSP